MLLIFGAAVGTFLSALFWSLSNIEYQSTLELVGSSVFLVVTTVALILAWIRDMAYNKRLVKASKIVLNKQRDTLEENV